MDSAQMLAWVRDWDRRLVADLRPLTETAEGKDAVRSVLRPGASGRQITAAERRLGIRLPAGLRRFLAVTDGAYADPGGIVGPQQQRLHCSVEGVGFLPVADLTWLDEVEADRVAILAETFPGPGTLTQAGQSPDGMSPLRDQRCLLVGSSDEADLGTVLVPAGRAWQLWFCTRDEVRAWPSFEAWLADAATKPGVEHVLQLIAWTRSRDPRGEKLADVRDPAAKPILLAALEELGDDGAVVGRLMHCLPRLGGDDVVEAWVRWRDLHLGDRARRERFPALANDENRILAGAMVRHGSAAACDVLAQLGEWDMLYRLHDPRGIVLAVRDMRAGSPAPASLFATIAHPSFVSVLRQARASGQPRVTRKDDTVGGFNMSAALLSCGAPEGRTELEEMVATDARHAGAAAVVLAEHDAQHIGGAGAGDPAQGGPGKPQV